MSKKSIVKFKTVLLIIMIVLFLAVIKISAVNRIFAAGNPAFTAETVKVLPAVDIKGIEYNRMVIYNE